MFESLSDARILVEVARLGSFAAAAQALSAPRSTVSRRIAHLEKIAGARLFERTTRRVRITEAGQVLLEHAARIVQEDREAAAALEALAGAPRGRIRLTAPIILGQAVLRPLIVDFIARYEGCEVFLDLVNRRVDLIGERYDAALRLGPLQDSELVTTRIGAVEARLYAAPGAVIDTPSDLEGRDMLLLGGDDLQADVLMLSGTDGAVASVGVNPRLITDDPGTLERAARNGLGIAVLPSFTGAAGVEDGALDAVLPGWVVRRSDVRLVTVSRQLRRPVVQAFVDFIEPRLRAALSV